MAKPRNIPDLTSAEALDTYPAGLKVASGGGPAWRDVKVSVFSLDSRAEQFPMPAVVEPFIVWVISGEAETMERADTRSGWIVSHVKAGSLFLTAAAVPYEFQWRRLSEEPFQVMMVVLSLPLFDEALREVHGKKADAAFIPDQSGFDDPALVALLERLRLEVPRAKPSALLVRGVGQTIAVHLARHYVAFREPQREDHSALPAYKLRAITQWMQDHLAQEFSLGGLAEQAGMSTFHFNRLFKRAMGMPPSQYQIALRLDVARQLLRETRRSVIDIANEVGYANPSHFARLFRKASGLTPSAYRRHPVEHQKSP
jgi:AraC family transcriptional regulator